MKQELERIEKQLIRIADALEKQSVGSVARDNPLSAGKIFHGTLTDRWVDS